MPTNNKRNQRKRSAAKSAKSGYINTIWKQEYYERLYGNEYLDACDDRTDETHYAKAAYGLALVDLQAIGECVMCNCEENADAKRESGERCDHRCGAAYPYSEADGGGASECGSGRKCSDEGWCQGEIFRILHQSSKIKTKDESGMPASRHFGTL